MEPDGMLKGWKKKARITSAINSAIPMVFTFSQMELRIAPDEAAFLAGFGASPDALELAVVLVSTVDMSRFALFTRSYPIATSPLLVKLTIQNGNSVTLWS